MKQKLTESSPPRFLKSSAKTANATSGYFSGEVGSLQKRVNERGVSVQSKNFLTLLLTAECSGSVFREMLGTRHLRTLERVSLLGLKLTPCPVSSL
jgi:hypothetical protein